MQTGRVTVWVKGKQNSGLVNFVPESRLHLHLYLYLHLSLNHGDRWGATDLATLSLHLISILFSDFLRVSQNFNPVHSEMLFSQRFFCRPLLLPSCTVRLTFVQIRSNYRKTTTKALILYQKKWNTKRKWKFEEMEYEFPFGAFRPEKQDCFFRCSVTPRNFPPERLKKSCSTYFQLDFP